MPVQTFNCGVFIDFDKLEQIFISLAPEVFSFFNKDLQNTTMTVEQSKSEFYEDDWSMQCHCLRNDTISIEISHESRYCDNSMTAQWLYKIHLLIQCSPNNSFALRLFMDSFSMHSTCQLFYESNPEYQAFIDFYLKQLKAVIQKSN